MHQILHAPRIGVVRAIERGLLADCASVRPGPKARLGDGTIAGRNEVRMVFVCDEAGGPRRSLDCRRVLEDGGHFLC